MNAPPALTFRIATEDADLAQVHQLNHRTFVEEIPQHRGNGTGALVDKFDDENTYIVARQGARVIGMITVRDRRPFSLDAKLPDLDEHLPPGRNYCEVRLLAVEPQHRNGVVLHGLLRELERFCAATGLDAAVISGTTRQLRLYQHLGFQPFGPRVGPPGAEYQPMFVTLDAFRAAARPASRNGHARLPVTFLPGPVDLHPDVRRAYESPPHSHRGPSFIGELHETRRLLCELARAPRVELLLGSGTLANDAVAAQLAMRPGRGLLLSNGEFGERLRDHATRAGLRFAVERRGPRDAFDREALERALAMHPDARWLWLVHHETSTGVLNDLPAAAELCAGRGIELCVDCVSSLGAVPVDLSRVHFATAVSGKALGSAAGLSMVFHQGRLRPTPTAPRYLDLSLYAGADGVPFTQPSNLIAALRTATLLTLARGDRSDIRERAAWLRRELRSIGLVVLAPEGIACPAILTLTFDVPGEAARIGDALASAGIETSYRSAYLRQRNWLQVALMGECSPHKQRLLVRVLRRVILRPSATATLIDSTHHGRNDAA